MKKRRLYILPVPNAVISIEFLTHYQPMKRILTLIFALGLLLGGLATSDSFAQSRRTDRRSDVRNDDRRSDDFQNDDAVTNSKLNNRRLEKNMDKYADQLQLTKRQHKQLKKIDRRYARMERKMKRRGDNKRSDRKRLAEEKRIEIIEILTPDQQHTLEALSKKGRFSLDQLFGR
ncbi:hypothetical protein SAMN05216327_104117 [Dyadobacter sp. SG02]|nr:hypothetical protein SAMN05216327_104117 [Dyadobacter sp. SG02]